nr:AAA family ATPase [Rhodovibrio salinarum]
MAGSERIARENRATTLLVGVAACRRGARNDRSRGVVPRHGEPCHGLRQVGVYANYQGLRTDPFPNRPSPEVFFDSSVHRGAWSFLRQALRASEPFILITGDFGAGKTLLALKLVQALEQRQLGPCVYVSTPSQSYTEVLRRSYRALGLEEPCDELDSDRLLERIHAYVETERPTRRLYLVLEDPQDLDPETLHKIRLLPNYNVNGHYPFCLIMFAHTSFPRMLREPRWQALDQRLKLRYHIPGLEREETREYIYFRLLRAQAEQPDPFPPYFEEDAIDLIQDLTSGRPREINNLCGMCLTLGGSRGLIALNSTLVREVAQMLGWPLENHNGTQQAGQVDNGINHRPATGLGAIPGQRLDPQRMGVPGSTARPRRPAPEAAPPRFPGTESGWGAPQPTYIAGANPAWGGASHATANARMSDSLAGDHGAARGGFGAATDMPVAPSGLGGQQPERSLASGGLKQYAWWFAVGGLLVLIVAVAASRNLNLLGMIG